MPRGNRQWLLAHKSQVLPKSPIAAASNDVLNEWEAPKRYTSDGNSHIDNRLSERTLKLIGMRRANSGKNFEYPMNILRGFSFLVAKEPISF